jgi:hypothetical protein
VADNPLRDVGTDTQSGKVCPDCPANVVERPCSTRRPSTGPAFFFGESSGD